jgi:ketosteroid isomerase-like protein
MRKVLVRGSAAGAAMLLVAACAAQEQPNPEGAVQEADVAEIRRLEQEFVAAELSGDVDAVLAIRTDDVVWMAPGIPTAEGQAAVRRLLQGNPAHAIAFTVTPARTEAHGDLAYNRGTWSGRFVAGTDTSQNHGRYVQIWRRVNGQWRIAVDMFHTDLTPD